MADTFLLENKDISLKEILDLIETNKNIVLSDEVKQIIQKCHDFLLNKINSSKHPYYGINTGFGSLYKVQIPQDKIAQLQENLVLSHACGMGKEIPDSIVKLMLLLKAKSLAGGYSGVRIKTVEFLLKLYNNECLPIVYENGSLGASGDLAPLAHMSLPLLGKGRVRYKGKVIEAKKALLELSEHPQILGPKEGLALLNGTQFMTAYGVYILLEAKRLSYFADIIGAMSIEGFNCSLHPFSEHVQRVRPHQGQIITAKNISKLLLSSSIQKELDKHVQDPYSFRCIPQVHGASKEAISYVEQVFITEINSVSDNPNIFPDQNMIISGGNFHGQPLALSLDFLAIALAELGSISERRTYRLISGERQLPPFLVKNPGLNSGLMIPQYTAASIVSQNKQLCTPCSVDSISSSNEQEDHVSMGANAAVKTLKVLENLKKILAIELMNASQAISFREPLRSSQIIEDLIKVYRTHVPLVENDREFHNDLEQSLLFIENYPLDDKLWL